MRAASTSRAVGECLASHVGCRRIVDRFPGWPVNHHKSARAKS